MSGDPFLCADSIPSSISIYIKVVHCSPPKVVENIRLYDAYLVFYSQI